MFKNHKEDRFLFIKKTVFTIHCIDSEIKKGPIVRLVLS